MALRLMLTFAFFAIQAFSSPHPLERLKSEQGWTFQVGDNWALNQPLDKITGLKLPADWKRHVKFHPAPTPALPAKYDLRTNAGGLQPVKNQGQCGSCWAFATAGAFEATWKWLRGEIIDTSEQEILTLSGKGSCGGGWWAHAYQVMPGASGEEECPYTASNRRCGGNLSHRFKALSWGMVGNGNGSPSTDEIKASLITRGALAVTVTANYAMQAYKGGVFGGSGCARGQENHMVTLIGWDDAKHAWLFQNSWGTSWGAQGFMEIEYGCSRIANQAAFVAIEPKDVKPVAFTMENSQVVLSVTIDSAASYTEADAREALQSALDSLEQK